MKNTTKKLFASISLIILLAAPLLAIHRDQMDLAKDVAFIQRVKMSAVSAAIAIQNESTGVANHTARSYFAKRCLNDSEVCAVALAVGVAADAATFPAVITRDASGIVTATNGATVGTDAAIDGRVSAIWNAYAVPAFANAVIF